MLFKQGWMGLPLFFIGLVSLAFSQYENQADAETLTSDQLAEDIRNLISSNEAALNNLTGVGRELDQRQSQFDDTIVKSLKKGSITENESNQLRGNFQSASSRFAERMDSTNETFSVSQNRLQDAKEIFLDLQQNFAGRLDEAHSPLLVLRENLLKTDLEINALSKMVDGVIEDFVFETDDILSKLEHTPSKRCLLLMNPKLGKLILSSVQIRFQVLSQPHLLGEELLLSSRQISQWLLAPLFQKRQTFLLMM